MRIVPNNRFSPEFLKEAIKAETELFKILCIFIIGLVTGTTGLILKDNPTNGKVLALLSIGLLILGLFTYLAIRSLLKIKRYLNQL